ncbi:MAG: peptide chain release factor-like protein [Polyangiaceae bacterium]
MTVAVLDTSDDGSTKSELSERDVDIQTTRGSGPGGQHRNKTDSCVIATHKPTGLRVRVDMRSQHQSRAMALRILAAKLRDVTQSAAHAARESARREQVGTGMRGDKIRTYRTQDDRVTDHRTNRTFSLKRWSRGDWSE